MPSIQSVPLITNKYTNLNIEKGNNSTQIIVVYSGELEMGKQSSISLPEDMLIEIDTLLEEFSDVLSKFGIDGRAKLVRLLVNFGKEPLKASLLRLRQGEQPGDKLQDI